MAALILAYSAGIWFPVARAGSPLQIITHAGEISSAPEDTLEGVLAAIEHGADGIEVDVDLSADGTWWLMHSGSEIGDTTTGSGDLSDLTDAVISALWIDGGLGYRPEFVTSMRVPRLSEVLEAVKGWHGTLYLDNTELSVEAARDLALLWAAAPFDGTKGVICFTPEVVEATKRAAPQVRTLMHNQGPPAGSPYLDAWLAGMDWIARPDVIALRSYDVEVFVQFEDYKQDERQAIERAYRWGAKSFLTWNLPRARTIVAELGGP